MLVCLCASVRKHRTTVQNWKYGRLESENDETLCGRKVAVLTVIAAVVLVLLFFSAVGPIRPALGNSDSDEIVLMVSPPTMVNNSKVQGEEFVVNVTALGTESLHGFVLRLNYETDLVECIHVQEGGLLRAFGNTTMFYTINNVLGEMYASVNLTSSGAMANGTGALVSMTFSVKSVGETRLSFGNVSLYDSAGSSLPYVTVDGYFSNKFNFDFSMPLVLFAVTLVSMFLNGKVENKLKSVMEEREFRVQDAVLLVSLMSIMIYLVVFVRQITLILMVLFLFAYSMLLFTFTYLFSKNHWYVGILPPAVFILLYVFARDTTAWTYYLSNIYGLVFAVLITLYMAGLFNWKTTAIFGVLITVMDIILVLVTGTMIQAAEATRSLSLPVMVSIPLIPLITTGEGVMMLSLGLGDFFFAGLLGIQTLKKYGKRFAMLSTVGMTVSFFIFEVLLLNYLQRPFPGTLMIVCGWAPFAIWKELTQRRNTAVRNLPVNEETTFKD